MRQPRALFPGEHAVLGLLALRPMHGYEMARFFEGHELSEVCPIEQSMLYTFLRNVEERKLVRWEEQRVGNRPPRKQYELTDEGRAELGRWLETPVTRIREVRLDFLLKLYFLHQLEPKAELELVRRQVVECRIYVGRLDETLPYESGFGLLVASAKRSAAEGTLRWLREYELELTATRQEALPG